MFYDLIEVVVLLQWGPLQPRRVCERLPVWGAGAAVAAGLHPGSVVWRGGGRWARQGEQSRGSPEIV